MKTFYTFFILFITSLLLFACSKVGGEAVADDVFHEDQNDDIFPVITIVKPAANQVYTSGDSIITEGRATDNKVMYKGKVQLINDITGAVVAEQYYESHFLSALDFRVTYKATVTASTDFTVKTEFEDHGLNSTIQTLKVKVNP